MQKLKAIVCLNTSINLLDSASVKLLAEELNTGFKSLQVLTFISMT